MTKHFLLAAIFLVTDAFGQTIVDLERTPTKLPLTINSNDTTLRVVYVNKVNNSKLPAYYLNGRLVSNSFVRAIDPKQIVDINVIKGSLQIDNTTYYGQVHIKTKNSYSPKIISLTELKHKYTNLKSEPTIFMVDNEIVTTDYDNYVLDENMLLRITVDKVENAKENIHLKLIKLLTKSEENLKKAKDIRIRGTEVVLTD